MGRNTQRHRAWLRSKGLCARCGSRPWSAHPVFVLGPCGACGYDPGLGEIRGAGYRLGRSASKAFGDAMLARLFD